MYTTVGLCIGTVTAVQKLQHLARLWCAAAEPHHALACLVHRVGGHLSKRLESRIGLDQIC